MWENVVLGIHAEESKVGQTMIYKTYQGEVRTARCTKEYFDSRLQKVMYVGCSPNGHIVRLSEHEIEEWELHGIKN